MTSAITISKNHWRIPSVERAFDGWLEGRPTDQERQKIIAEAELARQNWKPSHEVRIPTNVTGCTDERDRCVSADVWGSNCTLTGHDDVVQGCP